jgi:hypothetical protein
MRGPNHDATALDEDVPGHLARAGESLGSERTGRAHSDGRSYRRHKTKSQLPIDPQLRRPPSMADQPKDTDSHHYFLSTAPIGSHVIVHRRRFYG